MGSAFNELALVGLPLQHGPVFVSYGLVSGESRKRSMNKVWVGKFSGFFGLLIPIFKNSS